MPNHWLQYCTHTILHSHQDVIYDCAFHFIGSMRRIMCTWTHMSLGMFLYHPMKVCPQYPPHQNCLHYICTAVTYLGMYIFHYHGIYKYYWLFFCSKFHWDNAELLVLVCSGHAVQNSNGLFDYSCQFNTVTAVQGPFSSAHGQQHWQLNKWITRRPTPWLQSECSRHYGLQLTRHFLTISLLSDIVLYGNVTEPEGHVVNKPSMPLHTDTAGWQAAWRKNNDCPFSPGLHTLWY